MKFPHTSEVFPVVGVYFINLLQAAFLYESVIRSFSVLKVCARIFFWKMESCKKATCKMLVTLAIERQRVSLIKLLVAYLGA